MGLDISLYERSQSEQNEQAEAEWEALYEKKESGEISEEEYDIQRKLITQYDFTSGDAKSEINPEHLFNRRYLRSSYNEGGFNSVANNFGGHDLYWIFEPLNVNFEDWNGWLDSGEIEALKECRERALQVAEEIAGWDRIMVTEFRGPLLGSQDHLWDKLPTQEQVLEWGREELTKERNDAFSSGGYSSGKGTVFPEGFEIHAITLGAPQFSFDGLPVAYGIYRASDETFKFYEEAARITAEFCDEAISLIKRDEAVMMNWSG